MALAALDEQGLLDQRVESRSAGVERGLGRPPRRIYLAGDAAYSIGLLVSETALVGGLFDLSGSELQLDHALVGSLAGPDAVVTAASELVQSLIEKAGLRPERVIGVGVGLAAPLYRDGTVVATRMLENWEGFNLATVLEQRVGLSVVVDNDANVGALGEHRFGAGRGCDHLLYVRLCSRVGLGMIIDGRLYRGARGVAGEFGHVSLSDSGPLCACGNRGCVEATAGSRAIVEGFRSINPVDDIRDVIRLALDGDRAARRAIADAASVIAGALAAAMSLFNPLRVVIGGELSAAGELLRVPLTAAIEQRAVPATVSGAVVTIGELGDRAELLGAATLHLPDLAGKLIQRVVAA
jgi:predicted NBD/HSP70 family sugar kinase